MRKAERSQQKPSVAIVIPTHKVELSEYEQISLTQCLHVLNRYPIHLVLPEGLTIERFPFATTHHFHAEYFHFDYFENSRGYNKLLLMAEFYKRFVQYRYILIYQLDAFVFRDELAAWCQTNVDYIGAPWFDDMTLFYQTRLMKLFKKFSLPIPFDNRVGNGGFSLRKVRPHLFLTQLFSKKAASWAHYYEVTFHEDFFWSLFIPWYWPFFRRSDFYSALRFSFETYPEHCYELNQQRLPFGCHAWDKELNTAFWRPFFQKYGYQI